MLNAVERRAARGAPISAALAAWWVLMGAEVTVQSFLIALGLVALAAGLAPLVEHGWSDSRSRVVAAGVSGAVLILLAVAWPQLTGVQESAFGQSLADVATDARWWLALFLTLWVYLAVTNVVALKQRDRSSAVITDYMLPFQLALQKWVVPRRLEPSQKSAIATFLGNYPPPSFPVKMVVQKNDEEASHYRADIQSALAEGGWRNVTIDHEDDMQTGVRLFYLHPQQPDPSRPSFEEILTQAFRSAGVQIDGSGGSHGAQIEEGLSISIGARRRDTYGDTRPWPFKK